MTGARSAAGRAASWGRSLATRHRADFGRHSGLDAHKLARHYIAPVKPVCGVVRRSDSVPLASSSGSEAIAGPGSALSRGFVGVSRGLDIRLSKRFSPDYSALVPGGRDR